MDWGDIGEFVTFGEVGHDQIDDASYYILVAPQNAVGNTILTNLGEMVRGTISSALPACTLFALKATLHTLLNIVGSSRYKYHATMLCRCNQQD